MKIKRLFIALCMALSVITVTDIVNPVTYVSASTKVPAVKTLEMQFNEGGKKKKIRFKNLPKDATVTYTSKNKKVAKVTKYGYVYPKGEGSTTIVCKVKSGTSTYRLSQAVVVKKVESYYQASDDNRKVKKNYNPEYKPEKYITPDGIRYEDLVWCGGYVYGDSDKTYDKDGAHYTGTIAFDRDYEFTNNQKIALYEFNTKTNSFDKTGKYLKMPKNYWSEAQWSNTEYNTFVGGRWTVADVEKVNLIRVRFVCYKKDAPEYVLVRTFNKDTALGWIKYDKKDWKRSSDEIIYDANPANFGAVASNQKIFDKNNGNQVLRDNLTKLMKAQNSTKEYSWVYETPASIIKEMGLGDKNGFYDNILATTDNNVVYIDIDPDIFFVLDGDEITLLCQKYREYLAEEKQYTVTQIGVRYWGGSYELWNSVYLNDKGKKVSVYY